MHTSTLCQKVKNSPVSITALLLLLLMMLSFGADAQTRTTSWKGATSGDLRVASNWSNGVPDANTAVIIGGSEYQNVSYYPRIQEDYVFKVASLTITSVGTTQPVKLYVKNLLSLVTITGDVKIIGTGELLNQGSDILVGGNWENNGVYTEELYATKKNSYYPTVQFSGVAKTMGGTSANAFNYVTVSGDITLTAGLTITPLGTVLSKLEVAGTLDPSLNKITFTATPADGFVVNAGATLKVKAPTYAENYSLEPTTLFTTSTIDYAAATGNQAILPRVYGILKISGGGVKSLIDNTTVSAVSAATQLIIEAGTLDLGAYSLARTSTTSVTGGTMTVANNAFLKIGGTGTFPSGFANRDLGSTSTVEYYGSNQTVTNETYGNLTMSGSGTKALPTATMTVSGKLLSSGSASFTAGAAINVSGDVEIGGTSVFNGSTFTHTIGGNWTDNATFTGSSSTVVLNGAGKQIRRTATGNATFNNLTVSGAGLNITAPSVTVSGNLATSGSGALTYGTGVLTMNGAAGVISGANISLNNLTVDGTNVTTTASFTVTGNLAVNTSKSFNATAGTILMNGPGTSITAPGTLALFSLRVLGTISTASSFNINGDLSGIGTLTATANTITFGGISTFFGPHNLFNVTVASGKSLTMVANANLGVAGTLTTSGTLNVTANTPNTIIYNGTAAQAVLGREYNNLVFANGGTKTTSGALTVNGNLTINSGSNLNAGTFSHTLKGNWSNSGTFNHQNGTINLAGAANTTMAGTTTFNILAVNKTGTSNTVVLNNTITTANLQMTNGILVTGSNQVNVTQGRTGQGWVLGTIRRVHAFNANTPYAFNGPFAQLSFGTISGVSEISSTIIASSVVGFPAGAAINGKYTFAVPAGTYANALVQLQYQDSELNGNPEDGLQLFKKDSQGLWKNQGKNANNATQNWVSQNNFNDVTGEWTLSSANSVYSWKGAVSSVWNLKENWYLVTTNNATNSVVIEDAQSFPGALDVAEMGDFVPTYQPTITEAIAVKVLNFKGVSPISLTVSTGSLTVAGNLTATGTSAGAGVNHTLNLGDQNLTVGGNLVLHDGSIGNNLSVILGSGTTTVTGDLVHAGAATIALGSGNFKLSGDYLLTALPEYFTAGTGTFTYQGPNSQNIGTVYYNNVTVDKSAGIAKLSTEATGAVGGTLTITNGTLSVPGGNYILQGDIVQTGGTLSIGASTLDVQKTWSMTGGIFDAGTSTVTFTGTTAQAIPAATFNHLIINKKAASTIAPAGNVTVNADLNIIKGILSLGTNTINRSAAGGKFIMGDSATLLLDGSNFPVNYNNLMLNKASTVTYQGPSEQNIAGVTYGNLTLANGGTNAKKLLAATRVTGDLTTNSGSTLSIEGQTLTLSGNFTNNGTYQTLADYTKGTLVLANNGGTLKQISGNLTVNNLLLETGSNYQLSNGNLTVKGNFTNQGSMDAVAQNVTFEGDFLNTSTLKGSGTTVFSGTRQQNLQLQAPIQGSVPHPSIPGLTIPPAVEFNGTVAPIFNSTASPNFGKLTIGNTDPTGIRASVGWTVNLDFNVAADAKFIGGPYTHNFHTAILNSGTIAGSGILNFSPSGLAGLAAYPLNFGTSPTSFQSTGTLLIGGSQLVALTGVVPASLNNLEISNTHAAGVTTQQLSTALPLSGTAWNLTGNLNIADSAMFNAGAGTTYTVGGNLIDNGTLNGAGGSFTLTNTAGLANSPATLATIEGVGTTTLGSLTIGAGADVKLQKYINILGNLNHEGKGFNAAGAEINFMGPGSSAILATGNTPIAIGNLKVSKTASDSTVTLGTNVTDVQTLDVVSGTMDLATYSMTVALPDAESEGMPTSLTVADNARLKIGGTSSMPQFETFALAKASTVVYYGSDQAPESIQYGNLQILNAGTKTFKPGTASIAGDFTKAAEALVMAPETIEFNGAQAQAVAAIEYQNLTLSNDGVKTLSAGVTGISKALIQNGTATLDAVSSAGTVNYNGALAQSVLPANYYNLALSNGSDKTFSNTTGIAAAFTLTDGASANLLAQETTIDFNGAIAQDIPALAYNNLTTSAAGIKTLQGNATVQKHLQLTAGEIRTGSHKITLGDVDGSISESETAFVTGTVETTRTLTAAEEDFGGLGITITNAATSATTASRLTGTAVGINGTSVKRSFTVTPTGTNTGLDATVMIKYLTHELNGIPEEKLVMYTSSDGVHWPALPKSNTTLSSADNEVEVTDVTRMQQFALGNEEVPLPVSLINFTGKAQKDGVLLDWATASEKDNAFFLVERSADGKNFQTIGKVTGNGNATTRLDYELLDAQPLAGTAYYRLVQTDFDGKTELSKTIAVKATLVASQAVVTVYPNPTTESVQVDITGAGSGNATVRVYTITGKEVAIRQIQIGLGQKLHLESLPVGTYILKISANGLETVTRIVKQ